MTWNICNFHLFLVGNKLKKHRQCANTPILNFINLHQRQNNRLAGTSMWNKSSVVACHTHTQPVFANSNEKWLPTQLEWLDGGYKLGNGNTVSVSNQHHHYPSYLATSWHAEGWKLLSFQGPLQEQKGQQHKWYEANSLVQQWHLQSFIELAMNNHFSMY